MQPEIIAEVLLNWLCAAAALAYCLFMLVKRGGTERENRLLILLGIMFVFFSARGVWWLWNHPVAVGVANTAISCLPLAVVVFIEGVTRRHSPLFLKLSTAAGTVGFVCISAFVGFDAASTYALMAYEVYVLTTVALIVILRDRASLSEAENHLLNILGLVTLISLPLVITDFQTVLPMPVPRLGSLGALIFIYAFVRRYSNIREARRFIGELVLIALAGTAVGLGFGWLGRAGNLHDLQTYIALGVGVALLWSILKALVTLLRETRVQSFQHWLGHADTSSQAAFISALSRYAPLRDAALVTDRDLRRYDSRSLDPLFDTHGSLVSARALRDIAARNVTEEVRYAAEQLADLLARNQCNRFCLLSREPLRALLVSLPEVVGTLDRHNELIVINKISEALSQPRDST